MPESKLRLLKGLWTKIHHTHSKAREEMNLLVN